MTPWSHLAGLVLHALRVSPPRPPLTAKSVAAAETGTFREAPWREPPADVMAYAYRQAFSSRNMW